MERGRALASRLQLVRFDPVAFADCAVILILLLGSLYMRRRRQRMFAANSANFQQPQPTGYAQGAGQPYQPYPNQPQSSFNNGYPVQQPPQAYQPPGSQYK